MIETAGQAIPIGRKISGRMKIVNRGPGLMNRPSDAATDYDGAIGIEIRGHFSSTFPQKPYDVETRDDPGNNRNVPLLGMPAENDWILLSNYNDKSFLRNWLAFELYRRMGHYAPRAVLCEVTLNSAYRGLYVFTEKIKRDAGRVAVAELLPDENSGDALTGGYIFKVDYHDPSNSWMSDFPPLNYPDRRVYYVYVYPKPEEITADQGNYLRQFVADAEDAVYGGGFADPLMGYRKYLDVPSFIDYFILSELSRNVDAYKKSRFFYKDRDSRDGLLHAGPPWDFDWAWKNIRECVYSATDGSGWSFLTNDCNPDYNAPDWVLCLLQDGPFTESLIERYRELRSGPLDPDRISAAIDSMAALLSSAQDRHFRVWPIAGPNPAPEVERASRSYDEEIGRLKNWIRIRIAWLDAHMHGPSGMGRGRRGGGPPEIEFPVPAPASTQIQPRNGSRSPRTALCAGQECSTCSDAASTTPEPPSAAGSNPSQSAAWRRGSTSWFSPWKTAVRWCCGRPSARSAHADRSGGAELEHGLTIGKHGNKDSYGFETSVSKTGVSFQ